MIEIGLFLMVVFCFIMIFIIYPVLQTGLNPIEYWLERIKELKKK